MNKIRDRWRFVAESWFALSVEDQKEALAVAAAQSGWPAYLREKDIWVVWALQILGTDQQLLQSLTFNIQYLCRMSTWRRQSTRARPKGAVWPPTASSSNGQLEV